MQVGMGGGKGGRGEGGNVKHVYCIQYSMWIVKENGNGKEKTQEYGRWEITSILGMRVGGL